MLDVLKKFALTHFNQLEVSDVIINTEEACHPLSVNKDKLIYFPVSEHERLFLTENGNILFDLKLERVVTSPEEVESIVNNMAPHLMVEKPVSVEYYNLRLVYSNNELLSNYKSIVKGFKKQIEIEKQYKQMQIKSLEASSDFLDRLSEYV